MSLQELLHSRQSFAVQPAPGSGASVAVAANVLDIAGRLDGELGAGCERVALLLPQGRTQAVTLLAAMTRGAAVPINPRLTSEEIAFALRDTAADALVVSGSDPVSGAAALVANELGMRVLDADVAEQWNQLPTSAARQRPDRELDEIAVLLHTSGTTAQPKLVPLTGANLLSSASAVAMSLKLESTDVGIAMMPLFHIHGIVGVLLASLVADASVVVVPFDAFSIHRIVEQSAATWISAVPTMYSLMLQRRASAPMESLRLLRSSSAALAPTVWAALEDRYGCPVVNSYGMTEAAHQMTATDVRFGSAEVGLVGRSAGTEIAVLVDGVPVACGVGEVLICGPGVMHAYLASADSDRAHLDPDAFVDRWFRTGDIGEIDRAGRLRLHGRSKEIINVGGEKVSPFEVEEVLLAHGRVREAVAYAMPSERLGEEVHAAVVISGETDERALRSYARERLAKFKTPTRIHIVTEIPKGPTGKVQRRLLADAFAATS